MVSAPYERKNGKPMKIAVLAVKAYISKSILPTYGRFSRARSHIINMTLAPASRAQRHERRERRAFTSERSVVMKFEKAGVLSKNTALFRSLHANCT